MIHTSTFNTMSIKWAKYYSCLKTPQLHNHMQTSPIQIHSKSCKRWNPSRAAPYTCTTSENSLSLKAVQRWHAVCIPQLCHSHSMSRMKSHRTRVGMLSWESSPSASWRQADGGICVNILLCPAMPRLSGEGTLWGTVACRRRWLSRDTISWKVNRYWLRRRAMEKSLGYDHKAWLRPSTHACPSFGLHSSTLTEQRFSILLAP